MVKNKFDASG